MEKSIRTLLVVAILTLVCAQAAYCDVASARLELIKKQIAAMADQKSPFEYLKVHLAGGEKYTFGEGCTYEINTTANALIVRDKKIQGTPQYIFPFEYIVAICLETED